MSRQQLLAKKELFHDDFFAEDEEEKGESDLNKSVWIPCVGGYEATMEDEAEEAKGEAG